MGQHAPFPLVCQGWQIEQTRATLTKLESGTLETIDLDDLIAEDLASGDITQEELDEAYTRYGVTASCAFASRLRRAPI